MSVLMQNRFGMLHEDDEPSIVKPDIKPTATPASTKLPAQGATLMATAKHNPPVKKEKAPRDSNQQQRGPRGTDSRAKQAPQETPLQVTDAPIDKPKGTRRNQDRHHGKPLQMDRKSRTGRVDGEKKQYSGKGSWGKPEDQGTFDNASHLNQQQSAAATTTEAEEASAPAAETPTAPAQPAVKTLDQYLAEKKKVQGNIPVLSGARQVNEGVDASLLKEGVVLKKKEEVLFVVPGKTEKKQTEEKSKPADKKKK